MNSEIKDCLRIGWPAARIEERGSHALAYVKGCLVADVLLVEKTRWAFFHYGFDRGSSIGDIDAMLEEFRRLIDAEGWTATIKGGNPLLGRPDPKMNDRDFAVPTANQLEELKTFLLGYLKNRFPDAIVDELAVYAGMGWVIATDGVDGLGVRDIDVNCFFKTGGPKSLAWITKLPYVWNGVERTIDLYWNTLPGGLIATAPDYIAEKAETAKAGRWLTIPERPWVSLLSGEVIWRGKMTAEMEEM
jgi:hypothetical protein